MTIAQIFIFIFGVSAIWLVGRKEQWKRWGFILGLCGQPFWFYTAFSTNQWGVLLMCLFYTYSWGSGVYTHWIKKIKTDPYADQIDELDEIFIPRMRPSDMGLVIASYNGDNSGLIFINKDTVQVDGTSLYNGIKHGSRYKYVEARAGGLIFKRIS